MVERKQNATRIKFEINIYDLLARVTNNKKEVDSKFNSVNIDLRKIYQEQETIRTELNAKHLIAAGKEAEDMSDIVELKTRVGNIETTVNKLVTDVAVINTTLDLRFNTTDTTLKDIKDALKEMKTDGVTSRRYKITTTITIAAVIVALLACAAAWYNATK